MDNLENPNSIEEDSATAANRIRLIRLHTQLARQAANPFGARLNRGWADAPKMIIEPNKPVALLKNILET